MEIRINPAGRKAVCYGNVNRDVPDGYITLSPDTFDKYKNKTHLLKNVGEDTFLPMCVRGVALLQSNKPTVRGYMSNAGICNHCSSRVSSGGSSPIVTCHRCHKQIYKPLNVQLNNSSGVFYCSFECSKNEVVVHCRVCDKEFVTNPSQGRKYCSKKCYRTFTTADKKRRLSMLEVAQVTRVSEIYSNRNKQTEALYRGRPIHLDKKLHEEHKYKSKMLDRWLTRDCKKCHKEFQVRKSYAERSLNAGWFCSTECRSKRVLLNCKLCGSLFQVNEKWHGKQKYCSTKCYHNHRIANSDYATENHRYNVQRRRSRIRKASGEFSITYFNWLCSKLNYVCQLCNIQQDPTLLTMDHIVPIALGGLHDNSNIQPLCPECNARKGVNLFKPNEQIATLYNQYTNEFT